MIKVQLSEGNARELREIAGTIKMTTKGNLQLSIARLRADWVLFRRSFALWKLCPLPLHSARLDKLGGGSDQEYRPPLRLSAPIGERKDQ